MSPMSEKGAKPRTEVVATVRFRGVCRRCETIRRLTRHGVCLKCFAAGKR